MKFSTPIVITLLASALSAFAQNVTILSPANGDTVTSGGNVSVQVLEQSSLTGRTEVGIAIGLQTCTQAGSGCPQNGSASDGIGMVLLVSSFNPQNLSLFGTYQNFSVAVPADYSGMGVLSVAHFYLLGTEAMPLFDVANVTVNITTPA